MTKSDMLRSKHARWLTNLQIVSGLIIGALIFSNDISKITGVHSIVVLTVLIFLFLVPFRFYNDKLVKIEKALEREKTQ